MSNYKNRLVLSVAAWLSQWKMGLAALWVLLSTKIRALVPIFVNGVVVSAIVLAAFAIQLLDDFAPWFSNTDA